MNKLAIERKVQYGAEKMLDVSIQLHAGGWRMAGDKAHFQVIEQRTGSEASETKERITAQLEAAANRIRELESRLERLQLGKSRLLMCRQGPD